MSALRFCYNSLLVLLFAECRDVFGGIEMSELTIAQSVECPLTSRDTAVLSGNLTSQRGTGGGRFHVSMRRVLSGSKWIEVLLLFGLGPAERSVDKRGFLV